MAQGELYQISEDDRKLFKALNTKLILSLNERRFRDSKFSDKDKFVAAKVAERAKSFYKNVLLLLKINRPENYLISPLNNTKRTKPLMRALQRLDCDF